MIIEQSFTVHAPRAETAAFFVDIDRVARCVPGVEEVTEVEPDRYQAVLAVRLGPIRAAFQGTMALDASEAPSRLKAVGEGRDRATGSVAKVGFTADLAEEVPGQTSVRAVADVALRGRMAQFGTGVMRAAAGELVAEFATCANATLAAAHGPPGRHQPGAAPATAAQTVASTERVARSRGMVGVLLRGVLRGALDTLRTGLTTSWRRLRAAGDRSNR